jgi:methanogenic corrinoid protein MtbC1
MVDCSNPGSDEQRQYAADLLRARMGELAQTAATLMAQQFPEVAARYRPDPSAKWKEHLVGRLSDLAVAVGIGMPEIFATQIAWARQAFISRGVPVEDLVASVEALGAVLERELPPTDLPVVRHCFAAAREVLQSPETVPPTGLSVATREGRIAAEYLVAVLEGDRRAATRLVTDAVANGLRVHDAYTQVLLPVQREVGRMWHLNELSIAEEHFATATTRSVMAQLVASATVAPRNGLCALIASVEGNVHDLGVRTVADFLEIAGWRVIELGADVPAADLVQAALDYQVDLVALSAAMPTQICVAQEAIALLKRELGSGAPPVLVGGMAFYACPDAWKVIGACGYATDAEQAVSMGLALVTAAKG